MASSLLTNVLGLPRAFCNAVEYNDHVSGGSDFGVTTLVQPPQKTALTKQHRHEIVEDVSSRVWLLLGTACHNILERAGKQAKNKEVSDLYEQRYEIVISYQDKDVHVACIVDVIEDDILYDYKVTSVYAVKDGIKEDWLRQLNYSNVILKENGMNIKALRIVAILRDWSGMKAMYDPEYPQSAVVQLDIPMWESHIARDQLELAVANHMHSPPIPCTDDERWITHAKWAVMKKGGKKAKRLLSDEQGAKDFIAMKKLDKDHYIQYRQATYRRCSTYCAVSKWCKQHNQDGDNE